VNLAILYIFTLLFFIKRKIEPLFFLNIFFFFSLNLVAFSINFYCFHLILVFSDSKPSNLGFRACRSHAV